MKLNEFVRELQESKELRDRYNEAFNKLISEGIERADAIVKAAAMIDRELDREEIAASEKVIEHELSEDELQAVSGGYVWGDDDAPDGHELTCLVWFYHGWLDFYEVNKFTYCKNGQGQKHVFGETFMYDYYWLGGDIECRKCTLCGEIVPVNPDRFDRHS